MEMLRYSLYIIIKDLSILMYSALCHIIVVMYSLHKSDTVRDVIFSK